MKSSKSSCGCGTSREGIPLKISMSPSSHAPLSDSDEPNPLAGNEAFITGSVHTAAGNIPRLSTVLQWKDYLGTIKVRCGIGRERYRVSPGLYAIGTPSGSSDVLVTANYKLTVDTVRKNLNGFHGWLLVLDTKGVNVWCSAGKGTFGTEQLVRRIHAVSLESIITHKRLILPQLSATGIAAHLVKSSSGFTVMYGPVRASDIQPFINAGYKATKEMRRVRFNFADRATLIPNDFFYGLRTFALVVAFFSILSGITSDGFSIRQAISHLPSLTQNSAAGYIAGIVLTPLFLPYIPVQNFAFKGFIAGAVVSLIFFSLHILGSTLTAQIGSFFLISGLSSFVAMNFTGSSTYTSLAGVKKEMKIAVPVQILSGFIAGSITLLNTIF